MKVYQPGDEDHPARRPYFAYDDLIQTAAKMFWGWKCQACGGDPIFVMESHHNRYPKPESLRDFFVMCSLCHATFEWIKDIRPILRAWYLANHPRIGKMRVTLAEIGQWVNERYLPDLQRQLDEIEWRVGMLGAMADAVRERREAA